MTRRQAQRWAMTRTGSALVLAATLGLAGCYDFDSPLDATPQVPRDEALVGRWRCLSAEPGSMDQPVTIAFEPEGDRGYAVTLTEDEKRPDRWSGYSSTVSGSTVLNLRDPDTDPGDQPWTLARYSFVLPNVVRFELVNDEPFRDVEATPAALRSALEGLGEQPGVFEDFCVCVRIVKED